MEKKTNIYVFDFGTQIKIGQSGNVKRRLRNIETQSGREAVQTFSIEADGRYENLAHKLLSEYRDVGEYFTVPFEFAVSVLKSLVQYGFVKDIKPESQLFLPLEGEYTTVSMDGLSAKEIAKILGISYDNVRKRIEKAKIKPITKDAIYPHDTVEKIRDVAPVGRPKTKTTPKNKIKKTTKKT